MKSLWSRRRFLGTSLGATGLLVLGNPRSAWSFQANEKLNIALIGAGGRGRANLGGVGSENIVALCDVDENRAADSFAEYPDAKKYDDYRKLLEEMDDQVDAVVVSAPNHIHAPASVMAMRMGKHVYCEKPGAHSVYEARAAREVAAEQGVVTQMGTQIHASDNYRRIVELIQGGPIGDVSECHLWLSSGRGDRGDRPSDTPDVPDHLNWQMFLGPAPDRPYHPTYHPHGWHWWWDFGGGELGNMGCHYLDLPFWALELDHPTTIEADGPEPHPESTPGRQRVTYRFPARGARSAVTLTWTHGNQPPPVFAEHDLPDWAWGCFVGSEGMLLVNYQQHLLLPEQKFADYQPPEPTIPSSPGHHREWINACKGEGEPLCHFGYSMRITESVLLGNIAYRTGGNLQWDADAFEFTNAAEANNLLQRDYRSGWVL